LAKVMLWSRGLKSTCPRDYAQPVGKCHDDRFLVV